MNGALVTITTPKCPVCTEHTSVSVSAEGWANYMCGWSAREAFPHLSEADIQMITSGTHPACATKIREEETQRVEMNISRHQVTDTLFVVIKSLPTDDNDARDSLGLLCQYISNLETTLDHIPGGWTVFNNVIQK